jgi:hypothetical protein
MLKCLVLFLFLIQFFSSASQTAVDSIPIADSARVADSLEAPVRDTTWMRDTLPSMRRDTIEVPSFSNFFSDSARYAAHPIFRFKNPQRHTVSIRQREGKETIFYSLLFLILIFAVLKNGFARYMQDLFKLFFRTTVRSRQIKEQLLQSPLPSFFLNIFFLLSGGMFLALVIEQAGWGLDYNFWEIYGYCMLALAGIYLVKFMFLNLMGWILQATEAVGTYIFIVFTTNKILGMFLLPVIILLAFTAGTLNQLAFTAGLFLVGGFFAYRYFLSYISVHRMLKISVFHFLLYLIAFEIVPLLLINKLLFRFMIERS